MVEVIRLGIIGLSAGNGHPYSWSAICNGFDPELIEQCGFPVIPKYLKERKYPDDFICGARVTHIWTQDIGLSQAIAKASKIDNVVSKYTDLISAVDAVLLARDDAENHLMYATPFLSAGIPIYIDKPLATSVSAARRLLDLQSYRGQIFSCSAFRYANELILNSSHKTHIGKIQSIYGFTPKDWDKYSVHIIQPILNMLPQPYDVIETNCSRAEERVCLNVKFNSNIDVHINTRGNFVLPINFRILGSDGFLDLYASDTFSAFKHALESFCDGVRANKQMISTEETLTVVSLIEAGRNL